MNHHLGQQFQLISLGLVTLLGHQNISFAQLTQTTKPTPIQYRYPKTNKIISTDKLRGTRWKSRRTNEDCSKPIALIPNKQGVAAGASPTLWFYLVDVVQFKLEVLENNGQRVYQYQSVPNIAIASGIVGIPLDPNTLDPDRRYQSRLSYRCAGSTIGSLSDVRELTGEIYRLDRSAEAELNRDLIGVTNPRSKIDIYLKHGVWYEMLCELFKLRQQQPQNLVWMQMWRELLQSPDVRLMDDRFVPDLVATEEVEKAKIIGIPASFQAAEN